jgi:hypothetical protein
MKTKHNQVKTMKKLFYSLAMGAAVLAAACEKESISNCDLPSTSVPAAVAGSWVNGYTSFTQVVDAYNGKILGTTWKSGRFMRLESNGKNAELFIMGGSMFSEFATKVQGTVSVNEANGTLLFHVCSAHYKGWQNGSLTVDRDATASEKEDLANNLRFNYDFETSGNTTWLQLAFISQPGGTPTSFRRAD